MALDKFFSDSPIDVLKHCNISNDIKLKNMSSEDLFSDSKGNTSRVNVIAIEDKYENKK